MTDQATQTLTKAETDTEMQMQIEGIETIENIDLDDYEIVSAEFFAQVKEPAFTINVNKITANAAAVRMLPDVDYVKILVNQKEKKLVLKPCDELDISGYKWARMKDDRRYASQRTGEPFVLIICKLMGWNPDYRYKIMGKKNKANGEDVLVFDLTVAQVFEKPAPGENGKGSRRSIMPAGWNGSFGPKFGENRRTLQVDTFSGYTVFSIKGDKTKQDNNAQQSSMDQPTADREDI
ncbi:MAG: integrase [Clostridiales bacterium]|nr:integrase [Clostridiales bacterium]MBR0455256.1 integrase [Bacillota bacterium]